MRFMPWFACPALIILAIAACHQQPAQMADASQTHAAPPSNALNSAAWEAYMVNVSHTDLKDISIKPYLFEVLAGNDPLASQRNPKIQQALTMMANFNRFPGNAIAVAGPNPSSTADVLVKAFGAVKPNSLKGLTVLYIGDRNNAARVKRSITVTGAAFRFASM
jgi:hypothetical protein